MLGYIYSKMTGKRSPRRGSQNEGDDLFFAGEDGHAERGDGHESHGRGDDIIGAGGGVLLGLGLGGVLGGGDNDDGMLHYGTIDGSGGINRTSFGHCLVAVGNIKGIAGRGNLALVEISFVPKEIWRLDIVVADSHISFQTFIEMKCIYIFCADRIIGYGNGGTLGKLNSRTISITLFGYPAQVFDCIVLNRSFSGFLINIDSTGIVGNNIIADIDGQRFSCAALQMHSISIGRSGTVEDVVRESNIALDIVIMVDFNAFELAVVDLKVNAIEEVLCGIQTIGCGARNWSSFRKKWMLWFSLPTTHREV